MQHTPLTTCRALRALPILTLLSLSLMGCSSVYVPSFIKVYQPDIAQGNILEPEQVAKIQVGMSATEVNQILGTPALEDIFHRNRRETYVFYDKRGKDKAFQHNLFVLYDANGRVAKIEQSGDPLSQAPAQDFPEALRNDKKPADQAPAATDTETNSSAPNPYSLTAPATSTPALGGGGGPLEPTAPALSQ
ncbi:outer membrane protein assembly factor BamE [Halothiobacillus sp.]|uniref:outer membrane protein assembly factor BamE n=1 Tax=Halothiobacillus sp. TaxID=1891311 RepID=UPI00262E0C7C|nr:outer membrane protein assembly factor BamE [Halothiobacillus sp.]